MPLSLLRTPVLVLPLFCTPSPFFFSFILLSHNTPDTLFRFFHPLCTQWVTSTSSSQSSANVDPGCVNVFTLFNVSPCNWISASWCSLHPTYSYFLLQIFNPCSSIAVLHSSSFRSTWSLLVLHNTMSSANNIHQGAALLCPVPSHPGSCQTGRGSVRILGVVRL